jgi:4-diphosphocytidyl-2-C-methyl-D-erythritol kinase
MNVHRQAAGVVVQAPAKVNLFFEILAKRNDGYHEIETLMVPIGLYDTLSATSEPDGQVRVACRWAQRGAESTLGQLPPEEENLATRAVLLLRRRLGLAHGLAIDLVKRIPSAAGLGGGSSDAAAALLAANTLWNLGLPLAALREIAAELGSDIPFFLGRGAAICRGRGELIEPFLGAEALAFVLVRPPQGLATAKVYANCRVPTSPRSIDPLIAALRTGDSRALARSTHNRLEEAAEPLSPWISRLRKEFASQDCLAAQMSGSGTAYFGICRHARHARRVARCLQARNVGHVYPVSSSN